MKHLPSYIFALFVLVFSCTEQAQEQAFKQERDTLSSLNEIFETRDTNMLVQALRVIPGQSWSLWSPISDSAFNLLSQNYSAGQERILSWDSLRYQISNDASIQSICQKYTFLIRQQSFDFDLLFKTLGIPDDGSGPGSPETSGVNSLSVPSAAITDTGDAFEVYRRTTTWASVSPSSGDSIRLTGHGYMGANTTGGYLSVLRCPVDSLPAYDPGNLYGGIYEAEIVIPLTQAFRTDIDTTIALTINRGDRFLFGVYNDNNSTVEYNYSLQIYGIK